MSQAAAESAVTAAGEARKMRRGARIARDEPAHLNEARHHTAAQIAAKQAKGATGATGATGTTANAVCISFVCLDVFYFWG